MAAAQTRMRLRIGHIKSAALFPFVNIGALARLGFVPALIALAAGYFVLRLAPSGPILSLDDIQQIVKSTALLNVTTTIAVSVALGIYAVGVHRLILRDEQPQTIIPRFRRYELAFLAVLLLFALFNVVEPIALFYLLAYLFDPSASIDADTVRSPVIAARYAKGNVELGIIAISALHAALLFWLHIRLMLLFPHAASTGTISPVVAWRAMGRNFWRGLISIVLLGVMLILLWLAFSVVAMACTVITETGLGLLLWALPPVQPTANDVALGGRLGPLAGTMLILFMYLIPVAGLLIAMPVAFASYVYADLVEAAAEPVAG